MLTTCPHCEAALRIQPGAKRVGKTADSYADCARVCARCGIALSNASNRPTFIRRDWRDGLWRRRTADRLLHVIERSLAEDARTKKKARRIDTTQIYASIRPAGLKRAVAFYEDKAARMLGG